MAVQSTFNLLHPTVLDVTGIIQIVIMCPKISAIFHCVRSHVCHLTNVKCFRLLSTEYLSIFKCCSSIKQRKKERKKGDNGRRNVRIID